LRKIGETSLLPGDTHLLFRHVLRLFDRWIVQAQCEAEVTSNLQAKGKSLDDAAIAALRRQESAAFSQLVATHQPLILGLGQSMGLRGADLEDAAAEVFAAVYRALPRFEGRSALSTWVYQIACRTFWRMRQRRDAQATSTLDVDPGLADAEQISPLEHAAASEEEQLIWSAVAQLDPRQAMAVELHYRRGLPVEEVAAAMECPEGTIKTLLFRARERLRQKLARKLNRGGTID
jgi:RNA polymerase sigma-70 factor (ECF subfamily)